jgi:hypothetical protein
MPKVPRRRRRHQSVGEFIRLWTRYSRWSSPKFLAGEATERRAPARAGSANRAYLTTVLISSTQLRDRVLHMATIWRTSFSFPTCTAIAWQHKRLGPICRTARWNTRSPSRSTCPRRTRPDAVTASATERRDTNALSPASRRPTSSRPTSALRSTALTRS